MITGILKKEEIKEYVKKDGTPGKTRSLFIEPKGSIYPVKVNLSNLDKKIGKEGETVTLEIAVYPYHFIKDENGNSIRKKAFMDVYVPDKK